MKYIFYCSIMKAAATGTWLGTLITALIVTDMMLQDNLYPNWAPSVRYMNTYIFNVFTTFRLLRNPEV